ncbi:MULTISPECIES: NAD(+) kinase [Methylococcus]|jgi:NAD+ kinase|uniref:NAD kinase n=1 Tax=Methylococcus capsulatus TaxID=414 RepID=A0AA35UD51_METCP|nr:NAD(+) kinase [Methylococcus capsulatus]QXP91150.1 NAD(+) kinase [Methylococcus capsulatus]CAI8865505.1 NAD kinase [Methylococcus capsulatus]
MPSQFRTIALIGKPDAPRIADTLAAIHSYLLTSGLEILVEHGCAGLFPRSARTGTMPELARQADIAVVVGGDGTLLGAARSLYAHGVPLVGINLGRLGFLVDISPNEAVDKLNAILSGACRAEERYPLTARLIRNGQTIAQGSAINEVVVHSGSATSMIELETAIDGVFLNSQRSDGLIVSTPTGSTAYALSAGGPILYPTLNATVLAPINPHTLSNRPIVISGDSLVTIAFRPNKEFRAQVSCDNVPFPDVGIEDRIEIRKAERPFRILHPTDYDFFQILRHKLNWSNR